MELPTLKIPHIDRFCCTTLRLGCIIIGACELVRWFNLTSFSLNSNQLVNRFWTCSQSFCHSPLTTIGKRPCLYNQVICHYVILIRLVLIFYFHCDAVFPSDSPGPAIIAVFEFLRYGIASSLLILGVTKTRPMFLIPWLFLSLESMYWEILKMVLALAHINDESVEAVVMTLFIFLFAFSLSVYFWLVVYSYYRQMKSEKSFKRLGQAMSVEDGIAPVPENHLHGNNSVSELNLVRSEIRSDS